MNQLPKLNESFVSMTGNAHPHQKKCALVFEWCSATSFANVNRSPHAVLMPRLALHL
jgi:hypothetical protein